jgi:hypothetical protein
MRQTDASSAFRSRYLGNVGEMVAQVLGASQAQRAMVLVGLTTPPVTKLLPSQR